ncbi:hypothetical protein LTR95_014597 [Oleoguttula sp. CCFEE 5521]
MALCARVLSMRDFATIGWPHFPIPQPTGTIAPATFCTPLSVANKLNCAAAFLVSCTSTLIPISAILCRVFTLNGTIPLPVPNTSKSGFGHTKPNTPQASSLGSNCPFAFTSPVPEICGVLQGDQAKASPPTSKTPEFVNLRPEFSAKPSFMQASIAVVGTGVAESMSMEEKSVWVSSLLAGPRS